MKKELTPTNHLSNNMYAFPSYATQVMTDKEFK